QRTFVRLDSPHNFSIGTRHLPFIPLLAWKGIARSAVHLLSLNELDEFAWFREAVSSEVHDEIICKLVGIACVISTFLPSMHDLFPQPELRIFRRRVESLYSVPGAILPAKMFIVKAASHVYQVPIFSDSDI